MVGVGKRRVLVVPKYPNLLFIKWLEEWLESAEKKNLSSKYNLQRAIKSLKKFPLPLTTGRDCKILRGFGPTLCRILDKKLEQHCKNTKLPKQRDVNKDLPVKAIFRSYQNKINKSTIDFVKSNAIDSVSIPLQTQNICESEYSNQRSFNVVLLVDTQEQRSLKKISDEIKLRHEIRRLDVGDYCWICRDNLGNEYVLPYIVERKRLDDFASSIRDGRFHEQKFRLRSCGLSNLIYLIENYGSNCKQMYSGIPLRTLMQAAINTQIHSQFQVKFTDGYRDSVLYISTLTRILIRRFEVCKQNKSLDAIRRIVEDLPTNRVERNQFFLMSYKEFSEKSAKAKQRCIKNIFAKQLVQMKSLSIDKALSIIKYYPTPYSLISSYKNLTEEDDAKMLLTNVMCEKSKNPIGAFISKVTQQFYQVKFNDLDIAI